MTQEALINEKEIDATGGANIEPSRRVDEPLIDPESNQPRINYLQFGRYKVGFIEGKDHNVLGISSIEIIRDFYDIDQIPNNNFYWDEEAYYD
jgi:hypothetical protein